MVPPDLQPLSHPAHESQRRLRWAVWRSRLGLTLVYLGVVTALVVVAVTGSGADATRPLGNGGSPVPVDDGPTGAPVGVDAAPDGP